MIGLDPRDLGTLNRHMDAVLRGHPYVKAPIDIACWDLLGKAASLPVCTLLGGRFGDRVKLYRAISQESPEQMAAKVAGYRAEGYRRFGPEAAVLGLVLSFEAPHKGGLIHDAREALDKLSRREITPDVIFLVLNMPIMDGFQFIERIRQHANPAVRGIPAAALTAYMLGSAAGILAGHARRAQVAASSVVVLTATFWSFCTRITRPLPRNWAALLPPSFVASAGFEMSRKPGSRG